MDITSVLTYFGITPASLTPLVVVGGAGMYFVFKHTAPVRDDVRNIRERLPVIESRVSDLWADKIAPAHSPRQLSIRGNKILQESGVKEFIDEKRSELLSKLRERNIANPYDAEKSILALAQDLPKLYPGIDEPLKLGAFKTGTDITTVLLVGGYYLRNLVFPELGFLLEDMDAQ